MGNVNHSANQTKPILHGAPKQRCLLEETCFRRRQRPYCSLHAQQLSGDGTEDLGRSSYTVVDPKGAAARGSQLTAPLQQNSRFLPKGRSEWTTHLLGCWSPDPLYHVGSGHSSSRVPVGLTFRGEIQKREVSGTKHIPDAAFGIRASNDPFSPSSTIYLQFFLLSAIASAGLSDLPGGIITQILKLEGFELLVTISFSGLCLLTITTGQGSTKMGHYWLWGQGNSSLCGSRFACCPASPLLAASVIVQAKTSTHISICLLAQIYKAQQFINLQTQIIFSPDYVCQISFKNKELTFLFPTTFLRAMSIL